MKKRIFCLLLAAVMVVGCVGCGSKRKRSKTTDAETTDQTSDGPAYVTEPITIDFWHTFGSGVLADYMDDVVQRFNETNEYGITVNATYIGSYATVRSQLTTSIGAGDNPQVAVVGISDILQKAGVLADMTEYVERDGVSLDDYFDGLEESMYYDGELTMFPFLRSVNLFYYNVDQFAAAGYDNPPTTVDEMVTMCKAVAKKNNNYGFEIPMDVGFFQEAYVQSLGADGLIDKDLKGASCLEDGSLLKVMTDWSQWCSDGWCFAPTTTSSYDKMYQQLYSGEIASCLASSAVLTQLVEYGAKSGQNIAVAPMPTYSGTGGIGGGGNITVVSANNSQQQIAAAWEFVKFLMSDEEVATRSKATGYLPTSQGAADLMADVFENDANMKIAFEARQNATDTVGSIETSEWLTQVTTMASYVIQDKSMTPQEGIDYLKSMLSSVFY